jgi:hypothetical protein
LARTEDRSLDGLPRLIRGGSLPCCVERSQSRNSVGGTFHAA